MLRILFDPDPPNPAGGGGTPTDPPPNPQGAPPQAAKTVIEGTRSEREVNLEAELEAERKGKKDLETKNAELQDQIHELTRTPEDPPQPEGRRRFFRR